MTDTSVKHSCIISQLFNGPEIVNLFQHRTIEYQLSCFLKHKVANYTFNVYGMTHTVDSTTDPSTINLDITLQSYTFSRLKKEIYYLCKAESEKAYVFKDKHFLYKQLIFDTPLSLQYVYFGQHYYKELLTGLGHFFIKYFRVKMSRKILFHIYLQLFLPRMFDDIQSSDNYDHFYSKVDDNVPYLNYIKKNFMFLKTLTKMDFIEYMNYTMYKIDGHQMVKNRVNIIHSLMVKSKKKIQKSKELQSYIKRRKWLKYVKRFNFIEDVKYTEHPFWCEDIYDYLCTIRRQLHLSPPPPFVGTTRQESIHVSP